MVVTVWTIGHSTHAIERFLDLLRKHDIALLVDIRKYPTSRWPQFKQEALRASLGGAGIEYVHVSELGGFRKGGYPSHLQTAEFKKGLEVLVRHATSRRTAIMCAEAVFFRCHRRYVSNALVAAGHGVVHIYPDGRTQIHTRKGDLEVYS